METRTLWRAYNKVEEIQEELETRRTEEVNYDGARGIAVYSDPTALEWQRWHRLHQKLEFRLLVRTGLLTPYYATWQINRTLYPHGRIKVENYRNVNPDERDEIVREILHMSGSNIPLDMDVAQDIRDYMQWVDMVRYKLRDRALHMHIGSDMEFYHWDLYETGVDQTTFWGYNEERD